ncbi:MAG: PQQ-binding-like beta-propeller repeat protein [Phycisphaerales bacterium JB063]
MSTRFAIGLLLGASMWSSSAALAQRAVRGQIMIDDWGGPIAEPFDNSRAEGFSVAAGTMELGDTEIPALFAAMDEGDWLRAIRLLESLGENESDALIRDPSGMLRPLSTLQSHVIAELPEEGRRTFRMMYDPIAEQDLADALALADPGAQLIALTELTDSFALCESAALAADRLGDLQFERGQFAQAVRSYTLAAEHPAGDPDDAMLLAKRLHALARSGAWAEFDELAGYAKFRRGNASVTIGGQAEPLSAIVDRLALGRPDDAAVPDAAGAALPFPRGMYPSAQFSFVEDHTARQIAQAVAQRNVGLAGREVTRATAVAADGRLYTLALGQLTAIAPDTGKTLWTHGSTEDLAQRITQQAYNLTQGYYQSLTLAGDALVVTSHDPARLDIVRLHVHDKATGELLWNSMQTAGEHPNASIISEPVVRDGVRYAGAQDRGHNNRMHLVASQLRYGGVAWTVDLGQPPIDPNWGQPMGLSPRIAVGERNVMVLTNDGALIAVDPIRRDIVWAMSYRILPSMWVRGMPNMTGQPGNVAVQDGVVYSKDTRDDRLNAIRESDAARLWSVEVDPDATLVHTDHRHAYLLGEELVAIDLKTGERVWWTGHHGNAGIRPSFTQTHALIAGPHRLCRVDLTTGKVDGYREDVPAGPDGSPTLLLQGGVAVVGPEGILIYNTEQEEE